MGSVTEYTLTTLGEFRQMARSCGPLVKTLFLASLDSAQCSPLSVQDWRALEDLRKGL